MKWLKTYQLFEAQSLKNLVPSPMKLLKLMESKLKEEEITQFFEDFIIPFPNFDNMLPVVENRGTSIIMKFGSITPQNSRVQYADNVYGTARFLSDYVKKQYGVTKELPYESEMEEDKVVKNYRTIVPNFYFEVAISGPSEIMGNMVSINTEYFLQYMDHSCDYSKRYSKYFNTLTKENIWEYIVEIADIYTRNIGEYNTGLKDKDVINHYINDDIMAYVKNNKNDYEVIGRLKEYPEVIQLLGLTQKHADDASGMHGMGFAD